MKYYGALTYNGVEPCGSMHYLILDGRNSMRTMIEDMEEFHNENIGKYTGFNIYKGNFRQATLVYTKQ